MGTWETWGAVSRMNFKLAFIALFVIVANFGVSRSPAPKPDGDVHVYMKGSNPRAAAAQDYWGSRWSNSHAGNDAGQDYWGSRWSNSHAGNWNNWWKKLDLNKHD